MIEALLLSHIAQEILGDYHKIEALASQNAVEASCMQLAWLLTF